MKRYIFLLIVLIATAIQPLTAQTAKKLFLAMPDSLLPLLNANNRADCTDFIANKMKAEVKNAFGKMTVMTDMTADYIRLQTTESSVWTMKLLPSSATDTTKIICVVRTVKAPVADSDIHFYDTTWNELPIADHLQMPATDDFFVAVPAAADDSLAAAFQEARRNADILMNEALLDKNSNALTFHFTTPDFEGKDKAAQMKAFIKKDLVYRWRDGRFVKE